MGGQVNNFGAHFLDDGTILYPSLLECSKGMYFISLSDGEGNNNIVFKGPDIHYFAGAHMALEHIKELKR